LSGKSTSAAPEWLGGTLVVPTLVVLDELPLNANGKVDRAALRRRVLPAPRRHAAPRTPDEELTVGIWREVLGVGQVGIDDNFFRLGGHSLLATQIISRVRTVFGIEVPLDTLFDAPTPAGLAAAVDRLRAAGRGVADPPVTASRRVSPIPLSFAQERLWFLAQLDPESAVLIGRYTGRRDVVVGSPVAGRNRREIEGLIGFFVNMLVLRTDLGADPSFRELLATVRRTALDAYAHQDLPFERLVEELQPERHLSTTALFRVMLVLQNTPQAAGRRLPGTAVETATAAVETGTGTAKFELSLSLQEGDAGIGGVIEYSTDLFDAATVERLAGHFECLLAAAVEDPGLRISRLPWLQPPQRRQLLAEWNDTRVDRPALCIPELFTAQVERRPEATALVFERERWSYRALDRRAERLARHLRTLGVGPEVRVGVCAHRSTELVVALLGILKAGGAYVPIDPELPEARRRFLVEAAGVRLVLTPESLHAAMPETPEPRLPVAADNLAYVLFTSGSTGAAGHAGHLATAAGRGLASHPGTAGALRRRGGGAGVGRGPGVRRRLGMEPLRT
ncbi:MAG: AMP-binding protein, partial [bacterium]|nr:AMP-binding protein [bacterium]